MSKKSTKKPKALAKKIVTKVSISSDSEKPVWCFDKVDRDGVFSFKEQLEYKGLSEKEFAAKMGLSDMYASQLINGTMQLTDDIAASLEAVLGIPARFWHKLEAEYRDTILKVNAENAKTDGKIAGKWVPNNYGTLKAAEV